MATATAGRKLGTVYRNETLPEWGSSACYATIFNYFENAFETKREVYQYFAYRPTPAIVFSQLNLSYYFSTHL